MRSWEFKEVQGSFRLLASMNIHLQKKITYLENGEYFESLPIIVSYNYL